MVLRHEFKYQIDNLDYRILQKKLCTFLKPDSNMKPKSSYNVRTLYFDDLEDSNFHQKQAGVYNRKKYRLRIYNHSDAVIKFERKRKIGAYVLKETARLTRWEADRLLVGDYGFLAKSDHRLLREFYCELRCRLLHPVVIVEYEREAFVHPIGNVRITFDSCLRTGHNVESFFEGTSMAGVLNQQGVILEVKYNEVLPEYIRGLFPDTIRPRLAIGKFVICRSQELSQKGMH